jgi:hypothetical protein
LFAPEFSLAKQNGYSRKIQNAYVNSKYVIPFMLAAGLFYAFNYNNKATMVLLLMKQDVNY